MTPEGKVKKALTEGLDALGIYWFFPATHGYGRSGVPDIIACGEGRFFAFECKTGANAITLLQEAEINKIRAVGGHAYVVREHDVEKTLLMVACLLGKPFDGKRTANNAKTSRKSTTGTRLRPD